MTIKDLTLKPTLLMDENSRWQAFIERDTRYDGQFVTAVTTTGIFCRPSCSARKPHRENVRFFTDCNEAEAAGFRACHRCLPQEAAPQARLVYEVCRFIEDHLDEDVTLAALGTNLHVSPFHLQRVFKRMMGISPREYADQVRVQRLKEALKTGDSVTDAVYEAGYGSSSRVYENTPLGMTPGEYRRGGHAVGIRYTLVSCVLGWLLVAATEKGVCAVSLGDDATVLENRLHHEYPAAALERADEDLQAWVMPILNKLEGCVDQLDLPLDIQATAFQRQVWQALQEIPCGVTRSYSEIARTIGNPKATRAVARACASNPVALVIPCHRVVREDGNLGGYRWGLERKEYLLENERLAKIENEADHE